jgi:hypothetical protein
MYNAYSVHLSFAFPRSLVQVGLSLADVLRGAATSSESHVQTHHATHADEAEGNHKGSRSIIEYPVTSHGSPPSYLISPIPLQSSTILTFGPLSGETPTSLPSARITPSHAAHPTNALAGTHEPESLLRVQQISQT